MFDRWINQVREAIGPLPRSFAPDLLSYLAPPYADWLPLVPGDLLWQQYQQHAFLFENGAVSWGALVQSNNAMFEPGSHNGHAALAVFSPDEYFDGWPDELGLIAHDVYALRGAETPPSEYAGLKQELEDETGRYGRRSLPTSVTKQRQVLMVDVMIHREHLPNGVLDGSLFPLLHHPQVWPVWVVPARFWPADFIEAWDET